MYITLVPGLVSPLFSSSLVELHPEGAESRNGDE